MKVGDRVVCFIPCEELNEGAVYTITYYQEDIFGSSLSLKEYAVPNKRFNGARFRPAKDDE